MVNVNQHASRVAQRTIRMNPRAKIGDFFKDLKEMIALSIKSRKIIKEINSIAKTLSETEMERAKAIYEIHSKIYMDKDLKEAERRVIAKMFDNYVKRLEEQYPEHSSEEIRKFEEFVKLYKDYRNHDWARFALSKVGKRIALPEHIDTLKKIAGITSKLAYEHQVRVWSGLYKMANRSTDKEFHSNLLALNNALNKYAETGEERYIRMIHNNPMELHKHFPVERR